MLFGSLSKFRPELRFPKLVHIFLRHPLSILDICSFTENPLSRTRMMLLLIEGVFLWFRKVVLYPIQTEGGPNSSPVSLFCCTFLPLILNVSIFSKGSLCLIFFPFPLFGFNPQTHQAKQL